MALLTFVAADRAEFNLRDKFIDLSADKMVHLRSNPSKARRISGVP